MVEILRFDEAFQRRTHPLPSKTSETGDAFSFWPEVSCGLWATGAQPSVDPANSQNKVLSEILLILGAIAAIAVMISLLAGTPPGV